MNFYNVLLAKKTNRVLQFGSLYERLFETWINRARQILKDLPTGSIATVNDAAELPLNALKVSVEAQQDLHGYDHPWVGGAGKNKWNGYVVINNVFSNAFRLPVNLTNFTISLKKTTSRQVNGVIFNSNGAKIVGDFAIALGSNTSGSKTCTIAEQGYLCIYVANGSDSDIPQVTEVQVEAGNTATAYEPYSNICPISGWDSGEITVCDDIQSPTQTETTSLDFPQTIYGAEWDVTDGSLDNQWGYLYFDGSENAPWVQNTNRKGFYLPLDEGYYPNASMQSGTFLDGVCNEFETLHQDNTGDVTGVIFGLGNKFVFFTGISDESGTTAAEFRQWLSTHPLQIKYPLATPTTIQLSPLSIRLLEGTNNLYADCGEVLSGKYWANV